MSAALEDDRAESIRMIRDSAAAVAPPGADLKRIRDLRFQDPGFDAGVFRQMGEMGWIGLRVPEALGGAGLGVGEMCALAEELGAALVPEPLIPCALSAGLLAATGGKGPLPVLLAGEVVVLTAWQEKADTLEVPGTPDAPRRFLPMASGADFCLLPVREGSRLALYELPAARCVPGVERTQDGGNLGTLVPNLHEATKLADDAGDALDAALDEAALVTSAYLLGGMDRAFAMTLDYLKTRSQFGKIIGTFQALQHKAADVRMQIALTRASVEAAAASLDAGTTGDARRAVVSRAKARAAESSLRVTRDCIQLHGGIGYTDQYDVGLYLRKAMVMANQYGSAGLHRRRFMATSPEVEE
jgi:alkylation response protein AidB-like acyl-CoA dehydrogenase